MFRQWSVVRVWVSRSRRHTRVCRLTPKWWGDRSRGRGRCYQVMICLSCCCCCCCQRRFSCCFSSWCCHYQYFGHDDALNNEEQPTQRLLLFSGRMWSCAQGRNGDDAVVIWMPTRQRFLSISTVQCMTSWWLYCGRAWYYAVGMDMDLLIVIALSASPDVVMVMIWSTAGDGRDRRNQLSDGNTDVILRHRPKLQIADPKSYDSIRNHMNRSNRKSIRLRIGPKTHSTHVKQEPVSISELSSYSEHDQWLKSAHK